MTNYEGNFIWLTAERIKEYRKKMKLSQEGLAELLGISDRTLRAYENNEQPLSNFALIQKFYTVLDIPSPLSQGYTHDEAMKELDAVWSLIAMARFHDAQIKTSSLLSSLTARAASETGAAKYATEHDLALVYFADGHIKTITSYREQFHLAIKDFEAAEHYANGDHTIVNLAVAHNADTLLRLGKVKQANTMLKRVIAATPNAHKAARGNAYQFLSRISLHQGNEKGFEEAMETSLTFAEDITPSSGSKANIENIHLSYNLYTVFDEYARGYARFRDFTRSEYWSRQAEAILPKDSLRWQMSCKATKAEIAIRKAVSYKPEHPQTLDKNEDFHYGMEIVDEIVPLARKHGHVRLIRMLEKVQSDLEKEQRVFNQASTILNQKLKQSDY